ncbi:hypothetical protein AB305_23845 [Salmonella enterica]|nr:hypothetical protein [Salmonella enterica]EBV5772227.1 hypothetical protein [Salmonella enterica subsp. enterica serovar Monophasic]EDP8846175.1 hypothetical protein [Salmonella enterica subsp. enterica serovar Norwich]EDX4244314.1 hypothetical protein [Salmonella enterica subsp. enterica serovar Daytona]EAS1914207.1 hypothetical protein [Salmonella enterica]
MSNIYKQALLVSKAKASVFTMEYISQFEASDIDSDDVDLRFEVDGVETGTTVSIVDECGHAAQIITALLDELEAARQRIAELEAREVTLPAEKFCPSEYAGSQYWEETEVWNKAISACAVAVRAAGIKVKG